MESKLSLDTFLRFASMQNSELPKGDPHRKFKGRVVFQGNRVFNQDWMEASFQDLGSAPAGLEASRWADA